MPWLTSGNGRGVIRPVIAGEFLIRNVLLSAAFVLLPVKEWSVWPCMVVHGINSALVYLVFPLFPA